MSQSRDLNAEEQGEASDGNDQPAFTSSTNEVYGDTMREEAATTKGLENTASSAPMEQSGEPEATPEAGVSPAAPETFAIGMADTTQQERENVQQPDQAQHDAELVAEPHSFGEVAQVVPQEESSRPAVPQLSTSSDHSPPARVSDAVLDQHHVSNEVSDTSAAELPGLSSSQSNDAAALSTLHANDEADKKEVPSEQIVEVSTSHDRGRDLPGPPTPLKRDSELPETPRGGNGDGDDEVEAVARAFGKSLRVDTGEKTNESTASTSAAQPEPLSTSAASPGDDGTVVPAGKPGGIRIGKGPPPTTQASEEKPFDFNRFLDQMRHRSAGPVGEYVRSFIKGFTKKPYRVADQTKLILDFLDFIAIRMRECEVWANLNAVEFENATEAMEKLVMNRLYNFTFSPAIRREGKWSVQTDDLERDRVLKQRISLFGWITEEHLDVPVGDHSKGFIDFAIQELLKINHYKAPRDKVICILNCCKVIFGLIRHLSTQENADTFVPILIFVVLRANPDNLISNVEYISRFRNPERLSSESGYYLSSLMGAIAFIETMDNTSLSNITQQQFEANVETAVQSISAQAEVQEDDGEFEQSKGSTNLLSPSPGRSSSRGSVETAGGELSSAQMTPQGSVSSNEDGSRPPIPISAGAAALAKDTRAFIQRTGEAARVGIGASLGGSMSALGRLFQDGLDGPRTPSGSSPAAMQGSGRDTPDILSGGPASGLGSGTEKSGTGAPSSTASARARMWNLFGVDEDQMHHQHVPRPRDAPSGVSGSTGSGAGPRPLSVNFGSWSRAMRAGDADSEPLTPQSEELRQGRFAPLHSSSSSSAPLSQRLARSFEARSPRTPGPGQAVRQESTDPSYLVGGEAGVRTPTDDGSDIDDGGAGRKAQPSMPEQQAPPALSRARRSDLSSYLPSFLTTPTPQQQQEEPHHPSLLGSPPQLADDEAAQAAAQIDRAHVDAGVDTLRSIFPDTDSSVCRLVLEGCNGDVQAAIDKLLEMS